MALFGFWSNYNKPGPGVDKDEPPKAAPIRFFEIYFRKFTKLVQANLIFAIPLVICAALIVLLFFVPTRFILQLPGRQDPLDLWSRYVMPLPAILLAPFTAGLTFICRNFAREEHAFVWSDFWSAVKNNWKYFLLNGAIIYLVYVVLSFSMIYYYHNALYVPFGVCIVAAVIFLFAQYYLPVMFITFDLKFGQAYKNAFIFTLAGFGRNILVTVILGALLFLLFAVMPIMPITVTVLILLLLLFLFSFCSFLINFAVYPIIDQYLIQPYKQSLKAGKGDEKKDPVAEKYSGLFSQPAEEEDEDDEDKYVYVNGRLIKKSELKKDE